MECFCNWAKPKGVTAFWPFANRTTQLWANEIIRSVGKIWMLLLHVLLLKFLFFYWWLLVQIVQHNYGLMIRSVGKIWRSISIVKRTERQQLCYIKLLYYDDKYDWGTHTHIHIYIYIYRRLTISYSYTNLRVQVYSTRFTCE